jgi:hypothetical protein
LLLFAVPWITQNVILAYVSSLEREVSVSPRLYALIIALCLVSSSGYAQRQSSRPEDPNAPVDADETRARIMKDMEKKAAKERVAALKNDTDKLLKLSIELKAYVDKSDENVLSLDVIKKADEIEKLAKSVRDKMKGPN